MGARASWLSVKSLTKTEVLDRLGLAETSATLPEPFFPRDQEICVSELPAGRILLLSGDLTRFRPDADQDLSLGCELVGGQIEEHVMFSCGWQCKDGELLWSATFDPDKDDLAVIGEAPQNLTAALKAPDADAFEIPLDVVAEIGRFKIDEDLDGWSWNVALVGDAHQVRRLEEMRVESAARVTARAERAAAWKASGGLAGAVRRMLGQR